jgi:hypothetical protein
MLPTTTQSKADRGCGRKCRSIIDTIAGRYLTFRARQAKSKA